MRTADVDSPRGRCVAFCAYVAELAQAVARAQREDEPVVHLKQRLDRAAVGLAEAFAEVMERKGNRSCRDD
jgi:hypothetical protein